MSIVLSAIRGVGGLFATALRVFALTQLVVSFGYGLLLAGLAFWLAAAGSMTRGVLAAVLALVLCVALGVLGGAAMAVVAAAKRAVSDAALGKKVFDAIFRHALGVSEANPRGDTAITRKLHDVSLREAQERLNRAADALFRAEHPIGGLGGLALWLSSNVQRFVTWLTIRVIVRQCRITAGPDERVDLLLVRDRLAGVIDQRILDAIRTQTTRMFFLASSLLLCFVTLLALLIRLLPI